MEATTEQLIAQGYRRVSRKFGIVARVDREDWREYMAEQHAPWDIQQGRKWVKLLGKNAADYYRRCLSNDKLEIGEGRALAIPTSGGDAIGFVKE